MRRILLGLFFVCVAACTAADPETHTFSILHTNDLHAHLLPLTANGESCRPENDPDCLGGFARIAGYVGRRRAEEPDLLLFDAGDRFSGTLFYTLHKSRDISMLMNQMDYTAMTLGNHDFDDGNEELERFVRSVSAPVLAANVIFPDSSSLSSLILPSTMIEKNGLKIGLVGLVTEETPHSTAGASEAGFRPLLPYLQNEVRKLRKKGAVLIIVISHIGYEKDREIAAAAEGINIIVGGHSHTLLSNSPLEKSEGKYPTIVYAPDGRPVFIVTAGKGGRHVGDFKVTVSGEGEIISFSGDTRRMDVRIPENEEIRRQVAVYAADVEAARRQPVFVSSGPIRMDKGGACTTECPLGEAVTDVLYEAFAPVDVVMINAGALRRPLPGGNVSFGDLAETYPFENEAVLVRLTGRQIRDMLEHGAARYRKGKRTNAFLQTAGLSYAVSPDRPAGQRVSDIRLLKDGRAVPLMTDRLYTVLTADFTANGGDGFPVRKQMEKTGRKVRDALVSALSEKKSLKVRPAKRIRLKTEN
jgi:5'-nucleotidase/UDP-sugar diphosphatase